MGIALPQLAPASEDRASGAQVIDGSLKFEVSKTQYLNRTFSAGNRKTWTWSGWIKKSSFGSGKRGLFGYDSTNDHIRLQNNDDGGDSIRIVAPSVFDYILSRKDRDTGWFHLVVACDTTDGTAGDRVKIYHNGVRQTSFYSSSNPSASADTGFNQAAAHSIGRGGTGGDTAYVDASLSNVYWIDGQALGPGYFGFTDPLTGTWRPKKFRAEGTTVNDGTQWSTFLTSTGALGFQANGFTGDVSTGAYSSDSSPITFTPPSTIHFQTLRVYTGTGSGTNVVSLSGGPNILLNNNAWTTVSETGGSFTSLTVDNTAGSAGTRINAIEVDGVIMKDSTTTNLAFGTNGFYLPMDGNSPIGQDKSGKGNNWTPVNFGGSVALPKATGARPILNTDGGGNVARVGVFGSEQNVGYAVTVYNDGGGNKYYIDGTKQATLNGLIRGATYTFDTSDSTLGSTHPFRLSATSAHGTEYTNGVAAITGAATTITVPYNAPNTLYYYCTSHSGMGADITGITTNEKLADQYASSLVLAMPLVGSNSDVSTSIACTMTNKAVASNGNAATSSDQSNFYTGSFEFDGSGDYLVVTNTSDLVFEEGTFTIECWMYAQTYNSITYPSVISKYDNGDASWILRLKSDGDIIWYAGQVGGGTNNESTTQPIQLNKWHHLAVVREGTGSNQTKVYVDGILQLICSDSSDYDDTNNIYVGRQDSSNANEFDGYISDVRIYKGVAKYTSNFVVPSTSPDILPDTPSGVSGSSKLTKITEGAVSFDGSGDDLEIADSADFEFGTGDFTIECFAYHTVDSDDHLISKYGSSNATRSWRLVSDGNQKIIFYWYYSTDSSLNITSAAGKFSLNRWHHIVAQRTSGDIYLFVDGELIGSNTSSGAASEFNDNSTAVVIAGDKNGSSQDFPGFISNVRIVKGTGVYNTTGFTPPTRTLTNVTNTKLLCCQSNRTSGAAAVSPNISGVNDGTVWSSLVTGPTRKEDRVANAFNGSTSGPGAIAAYPGTLTFAPGLSSISSVRIYGYHAGSGVTLHVNGSAQSPSSGASFDITINTSTLDSIVWTATNGFNYFRIDAIVVDGTTLVDPVVGPDDSNEAATTFNPFNTDINTVRGQESGYPIWNPLTKSTSTLSNGNLTITTDGGSGYPIELVNTFTPAGRGQWYWEFTLSALSGSNYTLIGMLPSDSPYKQGTSNHFAEAEVRGFYVYVGHDGSVSAYSGAATAGSATATIGVGGVVGWAYDAENGTLKCFINGVPQGTQFTNIRTDVGWLFGVTDYDNSATASYTINFGQNPFKYAPPAGFQPLNAANVRPETVITRPDQFFGVTTYSGSGAQKSIPLNMKPDLVWIKSHDGTTGYDNLIFDSVRGSTKYIKSNSVALQQTNASTLSSFNYNGFTLGGDNEVNKVSHDYVAWSWKAGGNKNTFNVDDVGYASVAAAGLDGGTLNPTGASVGTKQGFSIIKYTGEGAAKTINHGLNQAPEFMMVKRTDANASWAVYHSARGNTIVSELNGTSEASSSTVWNSATPTSSVFSIGDYADTGIAADFIAYLWHSVPGLQKFGKYTGNVDADGPYIELGFRPSLIIFKYNGASWTLIDDERDPINPTTRRLFADGATNDSVGTNANVDFLSNGFKIRTDHVGINRNGEVFYMAWAEAPAFNLYGGQSNAR